MWSVTVCDHVTVWQSAMHLCCYVHIYLFFSFSLFNQFIVDKKIILGCILANKLVIMSIYTHNWELVMNSNNRMLNIDKKTIKKNKKTKKTKKQIKNSFFIKKRFYWNKKTKNKKTVFYTTLLTTHIDIMLRPTWMFMDSMRKQTYRCAQYKLQNCNKTWQQKHSDKQCMLLWRNIGLPINFAGMLLVACIQHNVAT